MEKLELKVSSKLELYHQVKLPALANKNAMAMFGHVFENNSQKVVLSNNSIRKLKYEKLFSRLVPYEGTSKLCRIQKLIERFSKLEHKIVFKTNFQIGPALFMTR